MRDTSIVIKPADKGSSVVIMDRPVYVQEAMRQLNPKYYIPLPGPIYKESAILFRNLLKDMRTQKFLSSKQLNFLTSNDPPRPRQFYLLPKIHKPETSWTVPHHMPPGRPIVSDCGSESYLVASYIDYFLNPLSKHPSYIRHTAFPFKN